MQNLTITSDMTDIILFTHFQLTDEKRERQFVNFCHQNTNEKLLFTDLPLLSKVMHTVMSDITIPFWLMNFTKLESFPVKRQKLLYFYQPFLKFLTKYLNSIWFVAQKDAKLFVEFNSHNTRGQIRW
jgi:hypothetical protein